MARNLLALVGLWTIINFLVSIMPASFFEIFQGSQAVQNAIEASNTQIEATTGMEFPAKKSFSRRGSSRESECGDRVRLINELIQEKDECN